MTVTPSNSTSTSLFNIQQSSRNDTSTIDNTTKANTKNKLKKWAQKNIVEKPIPPNRFREIRESANNQFKAIQHACKLQYSEFANLLLECRDEMSNLDDKARFVFTLLFSHFRDNDFCMLFNKIIYDDDFLNNFEKTPSNIRPDCKKQKILLSELTALQAEVHTKLEKLEKLEKYHIEVLKMQTKNNFNEKDQTDVKNRSDTMKLQNLTEKKIKNCLEETKFTLNEIISLKKDHRNILSRFKALG